MSLSWTGLYAKAGMDYIKENPGRYVLLCFNRIGIALDRETYGVAWNQLALSDALEFPLKVVMSIYWYAILLCGAAGVIMFARRSRYAVFTPLPLIMAALMAAPVLIMATERYHYQLAPFLAVFAAVAVRRLSARSLSNQANEQLTVAADG